MVASSCEVSEEIDILNRVLCDQTVGLVKHGGKDRDWVKTSGVCHTWQFRWKSIKESSKNEDCSPDFVTGECIKCIVYSYTAL